MTDRKPKFEGVLSEPMSLGGGPRQLIERFIALKERYGVSDSSDASTMKILMCLAHECVPGFRFEKNRSSGLDYKDIIIFVELTKADEQRKSVSNAAQFLENKHPEWGLKAESIRQRFMDMKHWKKTGRGQKRFAKMVKLLNLLPAK